VAWSHVAVDEAATAAGEEARRRRRRRSKGWGKERKMLFGGC